MEKIQANKQPTNKATFEPTPTKLKIKKTKENE
jgi:hypothetical protein